MTLWLAVCVPATVPAVDDFDLERRQEFDEVGQL